MTESFLSKWTSVIRSIPASSHTSIDSATLVILQLKAAREETIKSAYLEARMVLERYEIGNASEQETAERWLLAAYEANQDASDHG